MNYTTKSIESEMSLIFAEYEYIKIGDKKHFYSDKNILVWKSFFEKQASHVAIRPTHNTGEPEPLFRFEIGA